MSALDPSELDYSLKIANGFCAETDGVVYCLEEDCFYLYEEGVYRKIFTREMHDLVLTRKILTKKMTLQGLKNVVDRIATIKQVHMDKFNAHSMINFKNGLFDIDSGELKEHTPSVISTIRLPYIYDKNATCPLWEKTLGEIMENDKNKIRTLQEFFGCCITREVKYEKALILIGEGANGKSTILHVLEQMVGEENCSALSLKYINDSQKVSVLVNKLVNICGEVSKRIEDFEAEFKTIVTGEKLTVSPKYVPEYTVRPFCKLVMAVNEFPYIDDRTSAFYRRLLLIELKKQFSEEEQNKNLRQELLSELPGIFNWAYEGLVKLKERNTFVIDEYMRLAIESMKEMNSPTIQWAKENLMVLPKNDLVKGEAFEAYKAWSLKNGYKPAGLAKFGAEIFRLFAKSTDKDRRAPHGERHRVWPNLAMRTPENELRAEQIQNKVDLDWKE